MYSITRVYKFGLPEGHPSGILVELARRRLSSFLPQIVLHLMFVLPFSLLIILAAASFRQSILTPQNRRNRLVARRRRTCHSLRRESQELRTAASSQHPFKPLAIIFTENGVNCWIESAAGAHEYLTRKVK